jgi:hypothetical protein
MCTQGKLPYQYVNTGRARLKKGKLRRVEVTPTSLAVDAVREGRRRPEEYSDDDGAIADAVCLPASVCSPGTGRKRRGVRQ